MKRAWDTRPLAFNPMARDDHGTFIWDADDDRATSTDNHPANSWRSRRPVGDTDAECSPSFLLRNEAPAAASHLDQAGLLMNEHGDDGCRVGIDLIAVSDVEDALRTHGRRYLRRVFTDHELECCRTLDGLSPASLAARWAAKEATIKVLQPPAHQPEWTSMRVRRLPSGACSLELSGSAADLAESAGITSLSLSMTHEGPFAAAVVFALCGVPAQPSASATSHEMHGLLNDGARRRKERVDA
jgi:holo-[acyl-carrier protein] synthase